MTSDIIHGMLIGSTISVPCFLVMFSIAMGYRGWANLWHRKHNELFEKLKKEKYKRCKALADMSDAKYRYYSSLAADDRNWEEEDYYMKQWMFYEKWKRRWTAIANKIKE